MNIARVLVTRRIPQAGLALLRDAVSTVVIGELLDEATLSRGRLVSEVRASDVLVSLLTETIDRPVLEANPRLLGVANYAVGFDNIDIEAATALGIPVSNTPGVLTETSADLAWALLLAAARRIPQAHNYMAARRYRCWGPNLFLGEDVSLGGSGQRKVLGIVGFGRIGRAVARRAAGFDMDVIAYDPYARPAIERAAPAVTWADLSTLLARSDFVTLHPLLSAETRHLIDETALRRMKQSAILVNIARGPIVNEQALVRALREGWIGGAALDVYEHEPEMADGLAQLPNVVLAPHIASASRDTRDRMAVMAATNAIAHLRSAPAPHIVNPQVYETDAYRRRTEACRDARTMDCSAQV